MGYFNILCCCYYFNVYVCVCVTVCHVSVMSEEARKGHGIS